MYIPKRSPKLAHLIEQMRGRPALPGDVGSPEELLEYAAKNPTDPISQELAQSGMTLDDLQRAISGEQEGELLQDPAMIERHVKEEATARGKNDEGEMPRNLGTEEYTRVRQGDFEREKLKDRAKNTKRLRESEETEKVQLGQTLADWDVGTPEQRRNDPFSAYSELERAQFDYVRNWLDASTIREIGLEPPAFSVDAVHPDLLAAAAKSELDIRMSGGAAPGNPREKILGMHENEYTDSTATLPADLSPFARSFFTLPKFSIARTKLGKGEYRGIPEQVGGKDVLSGRVEDMAPKMEIFTAPTVKGSPFGKTAAHQGADAQVPLETVQRLEARLLELERAGVRSGLK